MKRERSLKSIFAPTLVALLAFACVAKAQPSAAPPPRSIADITTILTQEKPDPTKTAEVTRQATAPEPTGADDRTLETFYVKRGDALTLLGRDSAALVDYTKALDLAQKSHTGAQDQVERLSTVGRTEMHIGHPRTAIGYFQQDITVSSTYKNLAGHLFVPYVYMAQDSAQTGDLAAARQWLARVESLYRDSLSWPTGGIYRNAFAGMTDATRAKLLIYDGKLGEAESALQKAVDEFAQAEKDLSGFPYPGPGVYLDRSYVTQDGLAHVLTRDHKLVEAEIAARQALAGQLRLHGRYATDTAAAIGWLGFVMEAQGRHKDAETLTRIATETFATVGVDDTAMTLNTARAGLGSIYFAEQHWTDAVGQFDAIMRALAADSAHASAILNDSTDSASTYALSLLHMRRESDALKVAKDALDRRTAMLSETDPRVAESRAIYASAQAATGDREGARQSFDASIPNLLDEHMQSGDEVSGGGTHHQIVLEEIVGAYLDFLAADKRGDAATQSFRAADAVRGQAVQQAVAAAAARADVTDANLAALIRRQQDANYQLTAMEQALADDIALPPDQQDAKVLEGLRGNIEKLRKDAVQQRAEIAHRYPEYSRLVNPQPATVAEAQRAMAGEEALLSIYVGQSKVYVWAVPKSGPVVFAVSPLSPGDVGTAVAQLRKSLAPSVAATGEIPAFDVATAYKLYAGLLEPVKTGWQGAKNLLVAANGPLGELPFGLLVTAVTKVAPEVAGQPMFGRYRPVPWLIRQVAVTQLPSVTSLTTLRASGSAKGARRPFVGFGDPWFSKTQQAEALAQQGTQLAMQVVGGGVVAMRGAPLQLRNLPKTDGMSSVDLGALPRLPDTADEVKEVAAALQADPSKDVYLGAQANEETVLTTKLDDRRVVMFATHGLVPGDLNGLTEPALALSSPAVANVKGDGLLTVSKILGLRLNADWVVLSACNTAAGNGAGAEAVSGLGLAFFYAGSHALLVSNWPVETTSARMITTDLFRREAATPGIARAEALRQAMLALIDGPGVVDPRTNKPAYTYAHPIFWAPFSVVGDGGPG